MFKISLKFKKKWFSNYFQSFPMFSKPYLLKLNLNSDKEAKIFGAILVNKISNQASVEMKHDSTERGRCSLVAV